LLAVEDKGQWMALDQVIMHWPFILIVFNQ